MNFRRFTVLDYNLRYVTINIQNGFEFFRYSDHSNNSDLSNNSYYNDEDSDRSVEGIPGVYYGGYGHCFRCGRRGHWANGCPNRYR